MSIWRRERLVNDLEKLGKKSFGWFGAARRWSCFIDWPNIGAWERFPRSRLPHIGENGAQGFGTDYVDIWHLHGRDTPETIPDEALEAMQMCKKSGKARFLMISRHDPNGIVDYLIKTKTFDVMAIPIAYAFPRPLPAPVITATLFFSISPIIPPYLRCSSGLIADLTYNNNYLYDFWNPLPPHDS